MKSRSSATIPYPRIRLIPFRYATDRHHGNTLIGYRVEHMIAYYVFDMGLIPPTKWNDRTAANSLERNIWTPVESDSPIREYRHGSSLLRIDPTGIGILTIPDNRNPETIGLDALLAPRRHSRLANVMKAGNASLDDALTKGGAWRLHRVGKRNGITSALFDQIGRETTALADGIISGRFAYRSHRHLLIQHARLRMFALSPLLADVPKRDWDRLHELLDAADSCLDVFMLQSDREARACSDLLLFIVSIATVIPVLEHPERWLESYMFWITLIGLLFIWFLSWPRK